MLDGAIEIELFDRLDRAIDRDPRHDLRMGEMAARSAHLPDTFIGLIPGRLQVVHELLLERPCIVLFRHAMLARYMHGVHHLAIHVELELFVSGVADAHRPAIGIARQPRHFTLGQTTFAGESVHDLHFLRVTRHRANQPLPPRTSLLRVPRDQQRI